MPLISLRYFRFTVPKQPFHTYLLDLKNEIFQQNKNSIFHNFKFKKSRFNEKQFQK